MKIPNWLLNRLTMIGVRKIQSAAPDVVIGGEQPYLKRWFVIPRNRFFNIYFHTIHRDDDDRALHDHPWWNVSLLLAGSYVEHTIQAGGIHVRTPRECGDIVFRTAKAAHRLEIENGHCWTLFITGPVVRTWGFHCKHGWVPWREFVDADDHGAVGRGCGEDA